MFSELHSGKPVMLVSSDNIPASMDVEITNFVSICPSTVAAYVRQEESRRDSIDWSLNGAIKDCKENGIDWRT